MMLTFTGLLLEVLDGSKEMTTRIDSPNRRRIYQQFHEHSADMDAHLWWLNPRTQSEYCMKIGVTPLRDIAMVRGENLTEKQAIIDGFGDFKDPLEAYLDALAYTNNLDIPAVLKKPWHLNKWRHAEIQFESPMMIEYHDEHCTRRFCPICKELKDASLISPSGAMRDSGGFTE